MKIVPVKHAEANEFVRKLHRHSRPTLGAIFCVGVADEVLRGVAICGRPVARMLDDGFPVPLAEALDKPALFVWSSRGILSAHQFIRTVTPAKILSKASSRFVVDDWPVELLQETARQFRATLHQPKEK